MILHTHNTKDALGETYQVHLLFTCTVTYHSSHINRFPNTSCILFAFISQDSFCTYMYLELYEQEDAKTKAKEVISILLYTCSWIDLIFA